MTDYTLLPDQSSMAVHNVRDVTSKEALTTDYYWCLQTGSCLPCSQGETTWMPPSSRIHVVISRIYQKAPSSRVVMCLLTFSERSELVMACIQPKVSVEKLLVYLKTVTFVVSSLVPPCDIKTQSYNVTFPHRKPGGEQEIFWRSYYRFLATLFLCGYHSNDEPFLYTNSPHDFMTLGVPFESSTLLLTSRRWR